MSGCLFCLGCSFGSGILSVLLWFFVRLLIFMMTLLWLLKVIMVSWLVFVLSIWICTLFVLGIGFGWRILLFILSVVCRGLDCGCLWLCGIGFASVVLCIWSSTVC